MGPAINAVSADADDAVDLTIPDLPELFSLEEEVETIYGDIVAPAAVVEPGQ